MDVAEYPSWKCQFLFQSGRKEAVVEDDTKLPEYTSGFRFVDENIAGMALHGWIR